MHWDHANHLVQCYGEKVRGSFFWHLGRAVRIMTGSCRSRIVHSFCNMTCNVPILET